MDFFKTLLVMLKRWYVALPVFAVTVGAAGAVYAAMPLHYESSGVIVLTSPSSGPTSVTDKVNGQTNPLLAFETSLSISASIVIQSINTPEVVKSLGADKPDHTFVLTGGSDGGPFITVKTESASEEGARQLAIQVLDRVKAELAKRQQALNAPVSTFIGVDDVVPPTKPEPLRGGKLRGAAVALVLGLVASLAAVYGLETIKARRRKRDEDLDDADGAEDTADEPVEDEPRVEPTRRAEPEARPATGSLPKVTRTPQPLREEPRQPVTNSERTQVLRPAKVEPGNQSAPNGRPIPAQANGKPVNGAAKPATGAPTKNAAPVAGPATTKVPPVAAPAKSAQPGQASQPSTPVKAGQVQGNLGKTGQAPAKTPGTPVAPPANGKPPARRSGNWPGEEYREPPTVRVKPAQTPPEPRG
ncbi:hypothetical protein [Actinokineospora sp. NBRC 105648]|uniref:hypothetical protein n=1 Tax=Actinokineospora sp. NBRC 105648 TaxID=3032206 RepID=UPI0024A5EE51|nr:hypothetical protein [Actinokineospora sp. NBRC 105648]GLZ38298.1 hypothetical protein Acsp05_19220 [Actinokineospora sp. NBRC 105648]